MSLSRSLTVVVLAAVLGGTVFAQTAPATGSAPVAQSDTQTIEGGTPKYIRDETPEQRMARIGTDEDPGLDPDPNKVYRRFGVEYTIEKYERRWANYQDSHPGMVRPFGFVNIYREIYQQNDLYVWVWTPVPQQAAAPTEPLSPEDTPVDETKYRRYSNETYEVFQSMRSDFTPLAPAASAKTITFADSSTGLPDSGSWRNSLAVADMNGDKKLDIIAPPERTGNGLPAIFLGDGAGKWTYWDVEWPGRLDYGSVDAADFNRDGKMDLVFGVHLSGIRVFLGDGKGKFTDSSNGLPADYATRRVRVADVNRDGAPDIVVINEGVTVATGVVAQSKLRAYVNEKKGTQWKLVDIVDAKTYVGGDHLAMGHFNSDKQLDFVASSVFMNATDLLQVSDGPMRWVPRGNNGKAIFFQSVYYANAAGRFSGGKQDDVVVSYVRAWPTKVDPKIVPHPPLRDVVGMDLITFDAKGEPTRKPVARWGSNSAILGMAAADFDGDGNLDFAIRRQVPTREIQIYLGDGKGGFTTATVAGIELPANVNYDLTATDVNGDKKPDLLVMYESMGATRFAAKDGAIKVYLNKGTSRATTAAN